MMFRLRRTLGTLLCISPAIFAAGQSAPSPQSPDPALRTRPPAPLQNPAIAKGHLHLDLSITDAAGNPVTDLQPWDLKLSDNGRPARILSFRGFDGKTVLPNPPVEVILVIDALNMSPQLVAFERDQTMQFLRQNGGKPALPISVMLLTDKGLRVQPQPSTDGNGMANLVRSIHPSISSINPAMGALGLLERFQLSIRELQRLADNEAHRPERKILLWMGPGWPLLDSNQYVFTDQQRRSFFDSIVFLRNGLRRAQIRVYSILPEYSSMGINESAAFRFRAYLNPVLSARQAMPEELGLGVFAEETGGATVGPSNDLVTLLNGCLASAGSYYSISFDPPPAAGADEYHALHIEVDRPGLKVRTDSGYYNELPPGVSSGGDGAGNREK